MRIGIINAHMFGMYQSMPSEHVNWNEPDYWDAFEFECHVKAHVGEVAAASPHLIIFEVTDA